jgi:tRNA1(Val) A37 N6-methylase TrmN6
MGDTTTRPFADPSADPGPQVATDAFLNRRLQLRQPVAGHRAGTDALLLAAAAPAAFAGNALDIGAGVGAAGLALAVTRPRASVGLVEMDCALAALARENCVLNGVADRVAVHEADVLAPRSRRAAGLIDESAALVVTNPPFLDPSRARLSPEPGKRKAHTMPDAGPAALRAWIAAALALVAPGGTLVLIHRPEALAAILAALEGRAGAITLLPILPRDRAPASRILVRARKGSRAPLSIAPPLVLHEGRAFTRLADAIHRGEASIDW